MPWRVTTVKRPRKTAAPAKKTRRTTTTAKTATPRRRTRKAAPADPEAPVAAAVEPAEAARVDETAAAPPPATDVVIVTGVPEPGFAARLLPAEPPPPRPAQRRGIFFDVENTSRAADISRVIGHLSLDWQGWSTEFTAVGNWRVIGHDTARLLAHHGAALVHSAPSVGVRDWSDLRIAVSAGVWLAGARPGDVIEIVSDDQAFDAVGDVAASLGVTFRRTSYRALQGTAAPAERQAPPASDGRSRRSRRGGRRRSDRRPEAVAVPAPVRAPAPPVAPAGDAEPHTAPHDEIVGVVRDLVGTSAGGVSLDALANALRERGFSRPPGSPRLVTRLRRIRELQVSRNGTIRLVTEGELTTPASQQGTHEPPASAAVVPAAAASIEPPGVPSADDEPAQEIDAIEIEPGDDVGEAATSEDVEAGEAGEAPARRRRRRGGRRRRGRRGGGNGAATAVAPDGA